MSLTPRLEASVRRIAPLEGRSEGGGTRILPRSENPTASDASRAPVGAGDQDGQRRERVMAPAPAPGPVNGAAMDHRVSRHLHDEQGGEHLAPADMRALLASLPVIEQAKGMLMGYYGVDADTAFELLRRWSSTCNIKLRILSAAIVEAAGQPHPEPYGSLQRYLHAEGLVCRGGSDQFPLGPTDRLLVSNLEAGASGHSTPSEILPECREHMEGDTRQTRR